MNNQNLNQQFQAWLTKPANIRAIDKLVLAVFNRMKMSRLGLSGFSSEQVDPDDIRQELMVFLLNDETMLAELISSRHAGMVNVRQFLWHRMIDRSRGKQGNQDIHKDTWRLFYRHALDVLGESHEFFRKKDHSKKIVFSMSDQPPGTLVMGEDLLPIAFPADLPAQFQQLNTRKNILALAGHFWDAAARLARDPGVCIDILDFMAWIGRYVDLQPRIDTYPGTGRDKDQTNPLLDLPAHESGDDLKKGLLSAWATNFYHLLREKERKIFFYYECEELSHKTVSELMDRKSTLSYSRNLIRKKLKSFLRALDWVSPEYDSDGQDPKDFEFFLLSLCQKLGAGLRPQEES